MRPVLLFKTVLFLSLYGASEFKAEAACSKLGEICHEDCDCCDSETKPGIKCESRGDLAVDRKCYVSNKIGDSCTSNSECKSQWCSGGICVPKFTHKPRSDPKMSSYVKLDLSVEKVIDGTIPNGNGMCGCSTAKKSTVSEAKSILTSAGTYSNNYALGSGVVLKTITSGPVRFMKICTANGLPNRDPTSYKIQRKCAETGSLKTIQEGALSFPMREKNPETTKGECTLVTISGEKSFYREYHITFPTQRLGDTPCTSGCTYYPTMITELSLLGHYKQVADDKKTPAPTSAPTAKTKFKGYVYVQCISKPCDEDGSWDQSDIYVLVKSNGKTFKTRTINNADEKKTYCWNQEFYVGEVEMTPKDPLHINAEKRWYTNLEVFDYDSNSGDDHMGDAYATMFHEDPKTMYKSDKLDSHKSDCRQSVLSYRLRAV